MDDLPVWGFVGELKGAAGAEPDALIYSHKQLDISYNGDRVSADSLFINIWLLLFEGWGVRAQQQQQLYISYNGDRVSW
jgi:hypothetical protein